MAGKSGEATPVRRWFPVKTTSTKHGLVTSCMHTPTGKVEERVPLESRAWPSASIAPIKWPG